MDGGGLMIDGMILFSSSFASRAGLLVDWLMNGLMDL